MSSGTGAYSVPTGPIWNAPSGDERVKQILADVARQVEQTSTRKYLSEPRNSPACSSASCKNEAFLAQSVGHDPADHISSEKCLLGCVFFIAMDYLQSFASSEIEAWSAAVRKLGGQVDREYSPQVTHVLCSSSFLDASRAALRDVHRVVTAYWLGDTIQTKRMNPPSRAIHLPCPFVPPAYPLSNLLVSLTGFKGVDLMDARLLLAAIGAIYTTHLTPRHTVLIAAHTSGQKYESALKWQIPVVNSSWLKDIYFGNLSALKLPVAQQYEVKNNQFSNDKNMEGSDSLLRLQPSDLPNINHLFAPWKHYLKVPRDALKRRITDTHHLDDRHRSTSGDETSLTAADGRRSAQTPNTYKPRVIITGFSAKLAYDLSIKVKSLGGQVLDSASEECSHLVAPAIVFTPKFLAAFSCCRFIVAPEWIEASAVADKFLPESGFQLRDPVGERLYGCNLLLAHERASRGNLFKDVSFFISPTIQPRPSLIRTLVIANGGSVLQSLPSAKMLLKAPAKVSDEICTPASSSSDKEQYPQPMESEGCPSRPSCVVIANPQDMPAFRDLYASEVPIHSVEFILTACLRQQLNYSDFIIPRS